MSEVIRQFSLATCINGFSLNKAVNREIIPPFIIENPKILVTINTAWNIYNFRAGLIKKLVDHGCRLLAVAPRDEYAKRLESLGADFIPMPMDNAGTHPARDMALFWRYVTLFRKEQPDVVLSYTVKPNIYASLAANFCGIPVINNISGLGATFINKNFITHVVRILYRLALRKSGRVFFQNGEDLDYFVSSGLVREEIAEKIPGSGIDLTHYAFTALIPPHQRKHVKFRFLLFARMLWDKGVGEYIAAARRLIAEYPDVEFGLLGSLDLQNPAAITRQQMDAWIKEGIVHYYEATDDVRPYIAEADCIVLPSYREGTPRSLLEAAAIGRPIVTTHVVGCKEVVDDGVNGLLCGVGDASDLAAKMESMLGFSHEEREMMGKMGREKVEKQFNEQIVIEKYLDAIQQIISPRTRLLTAECRLSTPEK